MKSFSSLYSVNAAEDSLKARILSWPSFVFRGSDRRYRVGFRRTRDVVLVRVGEDDSSGDRGGGTLARDWTVDEDVKVGTGSEREI